MTKNIERASKVVDFQLERLRVNLGVQIWVDASFGTGFGVFELSKCSLKYEPTVFNINTNHEVGIRAVLN